MSESQGFDFGKFGVVWKCGQNFSQFFQSFVQLMHSVPLPIVGLQSSVLLYPDHYCRTSGSSSRFSESFLFWFGLRFGFIDGRRDLILFRRRLVFIGRNEWHIWVITMKVIVFVVAIRSANTYEITGSVVRSVLVVDVIHIWISYVRDGSHRKVMNVLIGFRYATKRFGCHLSWIMAIPEEIQ